MNDFNTYIVFQNGNQMFTLGYDRSCVNYRWLNSDVRNAMKIGFKIKHVIDSVTGEILEQELDKIIDM